MGLKVIGAGFGRTGTLSLKMALEKLGFNRCYHMLEVHSHPKHRSIWQDAHRGLSIDWDELFEGYEASVDWPSCNLWREQLAHFPDARVILSQRDPDSWYDSIMATIYKSSSASLLSEDEAIRAGGRWAMEIIWERLFDGRMEDREYVTGIFAQHNEQVIREVPPEKLLVFEARQGWQPLCDFLERDVPDEPYPRVNSTEDFEQRMSRR